jgi:glycosyltransferase involved in cell wall biosynthesis
MRTKPQSIGVVITTYNSPKWLTLVLTGYECQDDKHFKILIADDGSGASTREVIDNYRERGVLNIEHYWQEDDGFQKNRILNKVIANTDCDYLIFTDGDCIPRSDFIFAHRSYAQKGYFLSGGYFKLTQTVSDQVAEEEIVSQSIFHKEALVAMGQPSSFKMNKLTTSAMRRSLLNWLTPTKATWNGMNSSTWTSSILEANGFDERMKYGGEDRELGERLMNAGLKSKQVRYSAICVHLEHARGYVDQGALALNREIRAQTKKYKRVKTDHGIRN